MYHKVVVLLDGSELAEGVLPHVVEIIRDRGSQVYLLSVAMDVRPPSAGLQEKRGHTEGEMVEYLRIVAKRLEPVAADVRVSMRFGRPADEILGFVNEVGADLIAMSTHGRSGISRWVFGSVADRVLRSARCPVLLVRSELRRERSAERQAQLRTTHQRILVPLDGSELAEQVLPYVKALIRPIQTSPPGRGEMGGTSPPEGGLRGVTSPLEGGPRGVASPLEGGLRGGTRIFLISVLTTGLGDRTVALLTSYPPGLRLATTALHHAEVQLRSYLRSVAAALREQGATVNIAVRRGSPADEILAYAAKVEADLISMTTHGFSGISRWVYGNVADKVLQGAHSPVLLVRPAVGTEPRPTRQGGN